MYICTLYGNATSCIFFGALLEVNMVTYRKKLRAILYVLRLTIAANHAHVARYECEFCSKLSSVMGV